MPDLNHKIIVDTNWLISYLIKKHESKFQIIFSDDNIMLYTSTEQIIEFRKKIAEEKFRKYFSIEEANQFLINFSHKATLIKVVILINACRDPKDNYLLSLAADASADFIITGDKDLLILNPFQGIRIFTINEFINEIN